MRRYSPTLALPVRLVFFVAALATLPGAVHAHTQEVMVLHEQLQIPYASLVKRLSPAAVKILTRKEATVRTPSLLFSSPIIRSFLGEESVLFGQRGVKMASSLGSGVIMRPASLAETTNHVIASSTQAIGTFSSPRTLGAEIVHTDKRTDVAALKVDMGDEMLTVEALT